MTCAAAPRRTLLCLLIAVTALLIVGAGQALAAQRPSVSHRITAVHHRAVAYADGTLTVARHGARKQRPLAHATLHSTVVVAHRGPLAYANGVLTHSRRHHHHRRFLAHTA
jgi:hypothetical protein